MNSAQPIAVYGATGNQGGAVVDALLARGASVRALVRTPESDKAQALARRGVDLMVADADDPGSLASALAGVQALFYMTVPPGGMQTEDTVGETRQGIALADAAAQARVPHVVFSSVGGAERDSGVPHFDSKWAVEKHLEGLDLPVVVIRPVFFMENLLGMSPTVENDEIVVRLPLPEGVRLQMIAAKDLGRVAATALLDPRRIPDGSIEIAGDELTGSEIAEVFAQHVGKPGRYEALPIEVLDGSYDVQAMFRWFAETPAYQADIAATRAAAGEEILDLPAWLAAIDWRLGEDR